MRITVFVLSTAFLMVACDGSGGGSDAPDLGQDIVSDLALDAVLDAAPEIVDTGSDSDTTSGSDTVTATDTNGSGTASCLNPDHECVNYTGSYWASVNMLTMCPSPLIISSNPCDTTGCTGSCTFGPGATTEYVAVYYDIGNQDQCYGSTPPAQWSNTCK